MPKEQAIERLEAILNREKFDPERAHRDADDVLCDLLIALGFDEVIILFKAVEKWYG